MCQFCDTIMSSYICTLMLFSFFYLIFNREDMLILLDRNSEVLEVPMTVFDTFEAYESIQDFKAALPLEMKLTTSAGDGIIAAMEKI